MPEIEVKFQVPADRLRALQRAVEASRSVQRIGLKALYFDTPQCDLAAAGMTLRLRREGRVWVQAIKAAGASPIARLEHEVALGVSRTPPPIDLSLHAGTPEGEALMQCLGGRAGDLVLRFETAVQRIRRELRAGGARVELALDLGVIRAGAATLPIAEIEFELLSGPVDGLLALAARWAERHHLWIDTRSKAERGHLLVAGLLASPATLARRPAIAADAAPDAALRSMVGHALMQILPNAAALAAGVAGPEHVHQARVGLRRLVCALRDFGAWSGDVEAAMRDSARQVFGQLAGRRDRDAIAAWLWPRLREAGAPVWAFDAGAAPADPGPLMRLPATTLWLLALMRFAHGLPAPAAAADTPTLVDRARAPLRRLHRRVHRAGQAFERQDSASLHRARKQLKRLRYGAEFLAALWPRRAFAAYLRRLRAAQEALGALQDAEVAEALYRAQTEHEAGAWFAVGWLAASRDALRERARLALEQLGPVPKFLR
jgi:triphosphatase